MALVSLEYPPETAHGGIGSQTYLKAHGLAGLGHDVHVISGSIDERRHEYGDGPVRVIRAPDAIDRLPLHTTPVEWLVHSATVASEVSVLHDQMPLDLVDFPDWGCEGYIHLLNQTEWRHIPTVIQLHGPLVMFAHTVGWPEQNSELYRVGTVMEGTCLRLADAIFSSGGCSTEWCSRHYGVDRERIPTLHMGVDTQLFCPRPGPKDPRPTIIFVGNVSGMKGAETLVEAACRLVGEYPDLRLSMVGRREERLVTELQAMARTAGAPDMLDLPGFIAHEELPAHLSRSHFFAVPSFYEGGPGIVYLEAMSCGLPVIGCRGSGAAEVVRHGETGFLLPPGDVDALVQTLERLLADPDECQAMGERARRYVLAEADSVACLKKLEAFYTSVSMDVLHAAGKEPA
ncbi:MAG: glycosyltransferase family 4 protein [Chloroflexota bacterium]